VTDPAHTRRLGILDIPSLSVQDAAWSADGTLLLVTGQLARRDTGGGAATLWDVADPTAPERLTAQGFGDQAITAAAMRPDGRTVALASGQEVHLWDVTDRHTPRVLPGVAASHPAVIRSVAFSPRADILVTGANDQTVALWPVGDGPRIAVLDVSDAVATVAITADGGLLAALDETGAATLWDVADPTLPVRLGGVPPDSDDIAAAMVLAPDGHRLLLGRAHGNIEVWDTTRLRDLAADPVRATCALTGRGPTETEWALWAPERPYRPTC
jgi:WD40 repeat protein